MRRPHRYTLLRPIMSDKRPIGISRALVASRYPVASHCTVDRSLLKRSAMVGIATLISPMSATVTRVPAATLATAHHL